MGRSWSSERHRYIILNLMEQNQPHFQPANLSSGKPLRANVFVFDGTTLKDYTAVAALPKTMGTHVKRALSV